MAVDEPNPEGKSKIETQPELRFSNRRGRRLRLAWSMQDILDVSEWTS